MMFQSSAAHAADTRHSIGYRECPHNYTVHSNLMSNLLEIIFFTQAEAKDWIFFSYFVVDLTLVKKT